MPEEEKARSWWQTLPGILTGTAAVIAAIGGLVGVLHQYGMFGRQERAASAHVATYLVKPVSESDLLPAIALAFARFNEFQELHKEVDTLRESLETRKLVERAKGILMRRLNLTEEEAFRRLQKRSQNENKKLGEIAQAIITADGMM